MSTPRLIWCHGSLSQPLGAKSSLLAELAQSSGLTMEGLDFQDIDNPDERVDRLVASIDSSNTPVIVAGSSMGGYVAAAACKRVNISGLFLLAPAFYLKGYDIHVFSDLPPLVSVIHGWNDDVVPVENSIKFAGVHKADLHIVDDGHRLSNSLGTIGNLFTRFLLAAQAGAK